METVRVTLLRHIDSGLYISTDPSSYPHTKNIRRARRFYYPEEVPYFLLNSPYRPDKPEDYELVTMKITYEVEEEANDGELLRETGTD